MLVFFATWCPHCQDGPAKVREFVENYGIEGPAICDASLDQTYRVSG